MKKPKILFVSQEIFPYLPETPMAHIGRYLPQGIQEKSREIRSFMSKFGCINERRNQLHEVIRLSGMNLIIEDTDHPLIIKVASIQSARMQVYFIDNDEYFSRKDTLSDDKGSVHNDNDERSIFFCRGVLETVKKLGWSPDVIHCHGWFTAPMGLLIKKVYNEDPLFADTKVVYSLYNDDFEGTLNPKFANKLMMDGVSKSDTKKFADPTYLNISKAAMDFADGVIKANDTVNAELEKYMKGLDKPTLGYKNIEEYVESFSNFYDEVLEPESVLAD